MVYNPSDIADVRAMRDILGVGGRPGAPVKPLAVVDKDQDRVKPLLVEDPFPKVVSFKPFTNADLHRALAMTVVDNAPTLTAVAATSAVLSSGFGPQASFLATKLAPLGYVGFKYAALAAKNPEEFWTEYRNMHQRLSSDDPSFWRGAGREFAFGTLPQEYADKHETELTRETAGMAAGMIFRDAIAAAGLGRAFFVGARTRASMAAAEGVAGAATKVRALDKLAHGLAFSSTMGFDVGVTKYNTEVGMGTNNREAAKIAFASGVATGASGALFMGLLPAAITKLGNSVFNTAKASIFISSAEFAAFAEVENQINNQIRTRAFDLEPEEDLNMSQLGVFAGIGLVFGVAGYGLATAANKVAGGYRAAQARRVQRKVTAEQISENLQDANLHEFGIKKPEDLPGQTKPIVEEVAQPAVEPVAPERTAPERQKPFIETRPRQSPVVMTTELPRDLRGAKPKYHFGNAGFDLVFDDDLDKALYIISNSKNKSRRDADYLKYAMQQTGLGEAELRRLGKRIRDDIIKPIAAVALDSTITIEKTGITAAGSYDILVSQRTLNFYRDMIDSIMDAEGVSPREAIEILVKREKVPLEYAQPKNLERLLKGYE